MLLPLALAQFIASFAGSNMNVAINNIAHDLGTDVSGVQTAITLFTLTMAALMIPGSKLSDILGRKRTFVIGLIIYGLGALIGSLSPGLGVLIIGYSLLEGIGSALMIPPIYILTTVFFADLKARAKAFGTVSALGGVGAAAGPLIGGIITTAISWRASFILQAIVVGTIVFLSRRIVDPGVVGPRPKFDLLGAILSALGLLFIVVGILQADTYGFFSTPVWLLIAIGVAFLAWFFWHVRSLEKAGKEPLLSLKLFKNRTSNLGLITQNIQWLLLMGTNFVVSVFLQTVRGFSAIKTGLFLTPATIGILLSSTRAGRLAQRFSQKTLIVGGFALTLGAIILLLIISKAASDTLRFVPGLFFYGLGIGVMLTASVNVVQSAFPEKEQGEISGLSRSVSNLGSSLGTAIAGTVLVSALALGNQAYSLALLVLVVAGLIGLISAWRLP